MICPKCHTVNDDEEKYCRECGFQLNSARICPTCGKTNDSNSKYCKECGTVLTPVNTFRKQVIEENNQKSFFSMYKIPIICALVIILAIGAVTGMAYYNGGSGGDDGFSSIIPTDDNGFLNDNVNEPSQAQMQVENKTNDTNASKKLTEKIENKSNQTSKDINNTVNKIKNQTKSSKNNTSKTITEKVNKTENSANKNKSDKSVISDSSKNDSGNAFLIPGLSTDSDDLNDSDNDLDDNDSDDLNDSDSDDSLSDDSLKEIEMQDVPNLAQKVSQMNYAFSTIEYEGNEYDEAQCIYIFSEYLLNIDKNKDSSIEIKDIKNASNPSGKDLSQSIEKEDYLSMAQRVHSWMDQKDTVPNYVGISGIGSADLSPKMMLKLFTLATLEYSITEELPESVEI